MEILKINPAAVAQGDLMAFTYYGFVTNQRRRIGGKTEVEVEGVDGHKFVVEGDKLIEKAASANQFSQTKAVTKTEAAELLISAHNMPFTVCFKKSKGEQRVLRGKLIRHEPLMGRSYVEDMEIKSGSPLRQVDHRNIIYLIVGGVKYTVK
jgi:hypothetical protein